MLSKDRWWVGRGGNVAPGADSPVENGQNSKSSAAIASVVIDAGRFIMSLGFGVGIN
jgi:hypothetical protein